MRKCHNYATYYLALLILFTCFAVQSATVVVRQDGQDGAYTTIEDAIANSVNGEDTIEIQQFTEAFNPAGGTLDLSWRNLICTAAERATINLTTGGAAGQGLFITNRTLQNVKLVGLNDGSTWQRGLVCYGEMTIDNCYITGFNEVGIVLVDGGNPITTGAVIKNTYVVGPKASYMGIEIETNDGAGKGPILIDHCTIATRDGFCINLKIDGTQTDHDYSNLTVKNTIMTSTPRCVVAENVVALAYNHSYNDFNTAWLRDFWYWHDGGDGNFVFESNTPMGMGDVEKIDPAFTDAAAGDFSLSTTSKCLKAGEDETNIGAWQGGGYPPGDVIVRQDGQGGAYTTIQEAIIYTLQGQLIEIQQFTQPFVIPEDGMLNLDRIGLFCSTEAPAVLDCQGVYGVENANNASLRNLRLEGNREGWQTGIKAGQGLTINNCYFDDFQEQAIWFLSTTGSPISGSIKNTYFFNNKIQIGVYEGTTMGSMLFDHCTFFDNRGGQPNINFEETFATAGLNGSSVEVRNSILRTEGAANVFAYYNLASNPLSYTHSYNDYINGWAREIWDTGNAGPQPLGTGDVDSIDPLFVDAPDGDLTLQSTSPLATAGEDGTTIGAFQMDATAVEDWNLY